MILILDGRRPIAPGLAAGLSAEGRAVTLDETTDLSSMREVRRRVIELRPEAVILPGGLDDAAACEADPDRAFLVNAEHPIHVAAAALEAKIPPILISTAEVFGGKGGPFIESDDPAPVSTWARTRLKGEVLFMRAAKDALVLRAGPILSPDLVEERQRLERTGIEEAADELVSPIAASELGRAIAALLAGGARGLFHVAPEEPPVSRAELWRALAQSLGFPAARVSERPGREIRGKAARARSPALGASKLAPHLMRPLLSWKHALPSSVAIAAETPETKEITMGHRQEVRRVDKPWGHEIIWAHTDRYVGKVLFIKTGERLSLQYHEKKDETVYVLSGKMVFEVGPKDQPREDLIMKAGDSYHITPYTVHRMIALEDTTILEASTIELNDVVRLEDKYGRAGTSNP